MGAQRDGPAGPRCHSETDGLIAGKVLQGLASSRNGISRPRTYAQVMNHRTESTLDPELSPVRETPTRWLEDLFCGSIFATFRTEADACEAVEMLFDAGVLSGQLSLLMSGEQPPQSKGRKQYDGTRAVRGSMGGRLGLLVGLGAVELPNIAPANACSPITAGIAPRAGDEDSEGLIEVLSAIGLSPQQARLYADRVQSGSSVLRVRCSCISAITRIRRLLKGSKARHLAISGSSLERGAFIH